MKVAIYLRVSTKEQTTDNQETPLLDHCKRNEYNIYNIYKDIGESGSKESRPAFDLMLEDMRHNRFQAVMVWKLDRIGRSVQHLVSLFTEFKKRGIEFISITQNIDTTTSEGRMFLGMLMVLSEYERDIIIDRVNSGIRRAKREGKHLGRPKTKINKFAVYRLKDEGKSIRVISKELELSTSAVQRCIKSRGSN